MTTTIIAEAGVNHNGSLELAKQMIEEAARAGADYIKFQTFKPENWFLNMHRKQITRRKQRAIMNRSYRCWRNWHCHMMILWN